MLAMSGNIGGWSDRRAYAFTVLILIAAFFVRDPTRYIRPELFAEDGTVYLKDAVELGAASLVRAQHGYQQLLHRALAFSTVAAGDFADLPAVWAWASAVLAAAILAMFATRLYEPIIPPWPARLAVSVLCALGGRHHELLATLTNMHWYFIVLGLHLLAFLIYWPEATSRPRVRLGMAAAIFVLTCSNPQLLIFAPAIVAALFVRRGRAPDGWIAAGAYGAGLVVQVASYLSFRDPSSAPSAEKFGSALWSLPTMFVRRDVLLNVLPMPVVSAMADAHLVGETVFACAIALGLVVLAASQRAYVLSAGSALVANALLVGVGRPEYFEPPILSLMLDVKENAAARYYYFAYVLLLLCAAIALTRMRTRPARILAPLCSGVLLIAALSSVHNDSVQGSAHDWRDTARALKTAQSGEAVEFTVPPNWQVVIVKR